MSYFLAETIGTMILIVLGGGVVGGLQLTNSKAEGGAWIVVVLAWGLAVTFAIYAVGKFSGAHINPAVTLGLAAAGKFPWKHVPTYLAGQFLGAFLGAVVVWLHYLPHWKVTEDKADKLAVFTTSPAIRNTWANLLSEIIGTFVLVFGLSFIGHNEYSKGLNPLVIGSLVMAIGFSLGGTTGYSINPARDLAPRIAHFLLPIAGKGKSDWAYSWIPVIGATIGGVYGALFYGKVFETTANEPLFWAVTTVVSAITVTTVLHQRKIDKDTKTND